ncbi:MAG: PHP domain-containing protein [Deltaproteobacteria bacterium]|nr:PHP domain-containing protein [Deltaproteobacteria bacterium]
MLEFMRNKVVNVARLDQETLAVHGVLDDSIYSLELNFKARISDLVCFEIEGRWLRWTTPECPRALNFLDEAEGFCLAEGIENTIHKTIGRRACRHFANLFIECAGALRETAKLLQWEAARKRDSELSFRQFILDSETKACTEDDAKGTISPASGGTVENCSSERKSSQVKIVPRSPKADAASFVVDLHVHTSPASPCASDSVDEMIIEAKRIGLNGICLSDHNFIWTPEKIESLRRKHDFLVLRANEIVTEQGDMLVYGFYEDIQGIIRLAELKKRVDAVGGFIVAAHPFRGFLTFGADDVGLTPEKAMTREMFKLVDAVETMNGKVTATENALARDVALGLGLPAVGGSDAHDVSSVGIYATAFTWKIKNEEELLAALKQGDCRPVSFR